MVRSFLQNIPNNFLHHFGIIVKYLQQEFIRLAQQNRFAGKCPGWEVFDVERQKFARTAVDGRRENMNVVQVRQ